MDTNILSYNTCLWLVIMNRVYDCLISSISSFFYQQSPIMATDYTFQRQRPYFSNCIVWKWSIHQIKIYSHHILQRQFQDAGFILHMYKFFFFSPYTTVNLRLVCALDFRTSGSWVCCAGFIQQFQCSQIGWGAHVF